MMTDSIPDGFVRISDATDQLAQAMWSGIGRPVPVAEIRVKDPKLSVRYGPWRDSAGQLLRAAAVSGALPIYVVGDVRRRSRKQIASGARPPVQLPKEVLGRLITSQGKFTDRPIQPSLKVAGRDQELFMALNYGCLVLRASEFDTWLKRERGRGKWPSQGSRKRPRVGRPTKQTAHLRSVIENFAGSGTWHARDGIPKLHRLLINEGIRRVPSEDTLARLVDRLYRETGISALGRMPRARRKTL